jgi:excisionase family DNA binding protein
MKCNLHEAALALGLSERAVVRLVRGGELPTVRLDERYLFNPVDLQEWGTRQNRPIAPNVFSRHRADSHQLSLARAIDRGGVHRGLRGQSRAEALDAVSTLPEIPPSRGSLIAPGGAPGPRTARVDWARRPPQELAHD